MDQTAPARRGTRVGAIWGSAEGGPCDVSAASRSHPVGTRCPLLLTFPTCQAGAEVCFGSNPDFLLGGRTSASAECRHWSGRAVRWSSCAILLRPPAPWRCPKPATMAARTNVWREITSLRDGQSRLSSGTVQCAPVSSIGCTILFTRDSFGEVSQCHPGTASCLNHK